MDADFMKRVAHFLLVGILTLAIAACGKDSANVPLTYVPADTPYLLANLEPMEPEVRDAMLSQINTQLPAQLEQYQFVVESMEADRPKFANLLQAFIAELEGKTVQQFAGDNGIDMDGLWALYGLGLSPVQRVPLDDPAEFEAFIARLEQAYGTALPRMTVAGMEYRRLLLDEIGLQVIIASTASHAVFALLPTSAEQSLLRVALGLDQPQTSVLDEQRLAEIAETHGYLPYTVGYVDLTRLPGLLVAGNDPMLAAILKAADAKVNGGAATGLPASCMADLERMASRVPMISFGATTLEPKLTTLQSNIDLADDIVAAFSTVPVPLPGLGGEMNAPFDLAIAFPLEQARKFWTAQIDAIAAKPFSCPAFADINAKVAELRPKVQMLAIPPIGTLRGLRISIDKLAASAGADDPIPEFSARLLVASTNPVGLLALAQTVVPGIAQLGLSADAQPVALPAEITATLDQPGWAAMSDHAIAVGVGAGADERLPDMLHAASGDVGDLMRMHMSGDMYRSYIDMIVQLVQMADVGDSDDANSRDAMQLQRNQIEAMQQQADRIDELSVHMAMQADGLEIISTTKLR